MSLPTRKGEDGGTGDPKHLDEPKARHHDACIRTTLTLDEDVARELQELTRRSGESFKEVVNDVLRRGLHGEKPAAQLPRFVVTSKACGFRPGVDLLRLNQLSDELEIEDFQRKLATAAEIHSNDADFSRFPGLRWSNPLR